MFGGGHVVFSDINPWGYIISSIISILSDFIWLSFDHSLPLIALMGRDVYKRMFAASRDRCGKLEFKLKIFIFFF